MVILRNLHFILCAHQLESKQIFHLLGGLDARGEGVKSDVTPLGGGKRDERQGSLTHSHCFPVPLERRSTLLAKEHTIHSLSRSQLEFHFPGIIYSNLQHTMA
jgi:hypothetical protein